MNMNTLAESNISGFNNSIPTLFSHYGGSQRVMLADNETAWTHIKSIMDGKMAGLADR